MNVTDLTGTTWVFNDVLDLNSFGDIKYITFIYNEKNFIDIRIVVIGNQWARRKRLQFTGTDTSIHQPYGDDSYWGESIHKTIQITGGTDATNSSFISWLEANATQVLPSETNRLYVKCNGSNHLQVKIPIEQTTDELAGTWVFKTYSLYLTPLPKEDQEFEFNFISNGNTYKGLKITVLGQGQVFRLLYKNIENVYIEAYNFEDSWSNTNYKTIEITSKLSEVTRGTDLLSWLKANTDSYQSASIETANTSRLYAKIKTKNLINFIIDGISYQAEEGMTWEDWVESNYNTNGFYIFDLVRFADASPVCKYSSGSAPVKSSAIIISDGVYYKGSNSGGAL